MAGVLKLAEALPQTKLQTLRQADARPRSACSRPMLSLRIFPPPSLNLNNLTNGGNDMSSVLKLAEVLPQTMLQTLR